jgi:hypothetical protein
MVRKIEPYILTETEYKILSLINFQYIVKDDMDFIYACVNKPQPVIINDGIYWKIGKGDICLDLIFNVELEFKCIDKTSKNPVRIKDILTNCVEIEEKEWK